MCNISDVSAYKMHTIAFILLACTMILQLLILCWYYENTVVSGRRRIAR